MTPTQRLIALAARIKDAQPEAIFEAQVLQLMRSRPDLSESRARMLVMAGMPR